MVSESSGLCSGAGGQRLGAFANDWKIDKHTKLYGEVEISCETRYFV